MILLNLLSVLSTVHTATALAHDIAKWRNRKESTKISINTFSTRGYIRSSLPFAHSDVHVWLLKQTRAAAESDVWNDALSFIVRSSDLIFGLEF